jgi:hypothetical protein
MVSPDIIKRESVIIIWLITAAAAFCLWTMPALAAEIGPDGAASHVGETVTVCGVVASAKYAANSRAQPNLLGHGAAVPE